MKSRQCAHQRMRQDFVPVAVREYSAEQLARPAFLHHAMEEPSMALQFIDEILKHGGQFVSRLRINFMPPAGELILSG